MTRQRGAIAIMTAVSMVILLALVGLVVDGGLAYMVKARLNAAVDSAALAAARAVPVGNNQAEQRANAQAAAADFFAANIPAGYLLSSPTLQSTTVTFDAGTVTIDVRAEAPMPVSFMQVLGFSQLNPVAYAQTIRKDLEMVLVVDTSGSLSSSRVAVKASAKSFLNKFNVLQDRVGLVHFAYGAEVDNAINTSARGFNRAAMIGNIDNYQFAGITASVEGMWQARNQLNQIPLANRSSLRVIVFFSDGVPNALGSAPAFNDGSTCPAGVFDANGTGLLSLTDSTGSYVKASGCRVSRTVGRTTTPFYYVPELPDWYNAHDNKREFPIVTDTPRQVTADLTSSAAIARNLDRASRNLPEMIAAKARDEGVFVFTLGMGSDLKARSGVDKEVGEDVLKCMANVADGPARCYDAKKPVGMYCYAATEADLTPCFSRLASAILRISK
jgi:Flp pilus assembly protein TadG